MSEDQVAPEEVAALLRTLHESAAKLLADQDRQLAPLASSLAPDGRTPMLGAYTGDEPPDPEELLDMLAAALREMAARGDIRAAAVCANVTRGDADALQYRVEGVGIDPFFVYYVYERDSEGSFAEPFSEDADDRLIFESGLPID